jgi:hypothetical protein
MIATSTATIRARVDHPTIDHRERLSGPREKNRDRPFSDFCTKKLRALWQLP